MRDWVATVETTHYCLGSVMGPHPYPWMVREFQRVVGDEAREQCRGAARRRRPRLRRRLRRRRLERGRHLRRLRRHRRPSSSASKPAGGAAIGRGVPGVVHGMRSYCMQDEHGQVLEAQSISAGLDYPGVGPEHAHLAAIGRAAYATVDRRRGARRASSCWPRTEGIIPALEPAHAIALGDPRAGAASWPGSTVLLNLSGRGDKDVAQMMEILGDRLTAGRGPDVPTLRRSRGGSSGLRARRDAGRKLLVPYVTGGLGDDWVDVVRAVADAGADAIEIGIPFSDPVMDGPTIQEASRAGAAPPGPRRPDPRRAVAASTPACRWWS